jgi:hypothetical protein
MIRRCLQGGKTDLDPVVGGEPLGHERWQQNVSLSQVFDDA